MDTITERTSGAKIAHTPGPWRAELEETYFRRPRVYSGHTLVTEVGNAEPVRWEQHNADARLIAAAPAMLAQLLAVRALIAEGAMTGFNPLDGDWAERLFKSQGQTTDAINKATRD